MQKNGNKHQDTNEKEGSRTTPDKGGTSKIESSNRHLPSDRKREKYHTLHCTWNRTRVDGPFVSGGMHVWSTVLIVTLRPTEVCTHRALWGWVSVLLRN
jgi:hypothetical protein